MYSGKRCAVLYRFPVPSHSFVITVPLIGELLTVTETVTENKSLVMTISSGAAPEMDGGFVSLVRRL